MALINCPECGKEVSDKAKACPNCAYPVAQLSNIPKISVEAQNIAVKWPVEILTPVERPELQKEEFCTSENRRKDRRIKTRKARILKVIAISSIVVAMILIATTSFFDMSMKLNLSDNDEKTDYFYQFQQYIIDNGYYDDERGAFLAEYVSNYEIRYIYAKDDAITYFAYTALQNQLDRRN